MQFNSLTSIMTLSVRCHPIFKDTSHARATWGITQLLFVGRVSIISGPNYSGKSIYAKQVNCELSTCRTSWKFSRYYASNVENLWIPQTPYTLVGGFLDFPTMIIFKVVCELNLLEDLHWSRLPSSFSYHISEALFQLRKLWLVLQTGLYIDRINSFLILNASHHSTTDFLSLLSILEITSFLLCIIILNCVDTF